MNIRILFFVAILLMSALGLEAQEGMSIFDKMYGSEIVDVRLETDLARLIDDRRSEEDFPAIFTIEEADGSEEIHQIKVKGRGKFRRKVCQFPPVKLNFSKGMLKDYGYTEAKYDKLKLVTHCLDDKNVSTDNVAREYLAYKLFNLITDQSFRVQLVRITYEDMEGNLGKIKRYGFIIEDTDEMAAALGGEECEDCLNLPASQIMGNAEQTMAVFQYMIGNEDWSASMVRNLKMVRLRDSGKVVPVPYDFDFAGLVDAPYALPNADYGLGSVKQRYFMGNKVEMDTLMATLRHFQAQKEALYSIIDENKLLGRSERADMIAYLDSFFAQIEPALNGEGMLPAELVEQAVINGVNTASPQLAK